MPLFRRSFALTGAVIAVGLAGCAGGSGSLDPTFPNDHPVFSRATTESEGEPLPEAAETACVEASFGSGATEWRMAYLKAVGALAARHDRRVSGHEQLQGAKGHELAITRESLMSEGVKVLRRTEEDGKRCVTVSTQSP